ncbi:ABC transporter permease [Desulfogranum japonicum]|uniref:ABC transporter permease n=1 Tax=Desulfogranum japonicum TaxID=231447 RepID=UPI0005588B5C
MIRKEWLQIIRDPSAIAIAVFLPIFLLLIFGYGISLDAKEVPLAIVVEQHGQATDSFIGSFGANPYFTPRHMGSIQEAENALKNAEVDGIVWLQHTFEQEYLAHQSPPVHLIVNGGDANTARLVEGYVQGIWANWLNQEARLSGRKMNSPLQLEQRIWFNPGVRSTEFLVPGVIAVIMTLIGSLLTALIIAREWERGTMETLLVTRMTVIEMLLGKLIPYFGLGITGLTISLLMGRFVFEVPMRGSLTIILAASVLYLLVALAMGLFISTIARSQFVAALAAMIGTFLPAFILSGFIFDIRSMPPLVQGLTHLIAARYYVAILQTLFLAGDIWPVVLKNSAALLFMGVLFFTLVILKTNRNLEQQ